MLRLFVEAATQESACAMFRALSAYDPEVELDDGEGHYFVSVSLGDDERTLDVLAKLDEFFQARAAGTGESVTVSGGGRQHRPGLRAVDIDE